MGMLMRVRMVWAWLRHFYGARLLKRHWRRPRWVPFWAIFCHLSPYTCFHQIKRYFSVKDSKVKQALECLRRISFSLKKNEHFIILRPGSRTQGGGSVLVLLLLWVLLLSPPPPSRLFWSVGVVVAGTKRPRKATRRVVSRAPSPGGGWYRE